MSPSPPPRSLQEKPSAPPARCRPPPPPRAPPNCCQNSSPVKPWSRTDPKRSYCCRFFGSVSTLCASLISLNFFSAALSPLLRSGWYFFASLRYAFLISSVLAFRPTPKMS